MVEDDYGHGTGSDECTSMHVTEEVYSSQFTSVYQCECVCYNCK